MTDKPGDHAAPEPSRDAAVTGRGLRVALGQILVEAGRPDANIARALSAIDAAGAAGADMLVLPECLDFGWASDDARVGAEPIPGPRAALLAARAGSAGIMVAAGLSKRLGDIIYNAAILVDRDGTIVGQHRKINELDFARSVYAKGSKLEVFDTSMGRIGLAICADLLLPEIGSTLAAMGAQLILSPSAWAVPVDHDEAATPYGEEWRSAYGNLARRHGVAVAAASNVGRIKGGSWHGRPVIGRSIAVNHDGSVAGLAAFGEPDLPMVELRLR